MLNLDDIKKTKYDHELAGKSQTYKRQYAKPQQYKGYDMHSTMEKDFAVYLDEQGIEWVYEPAPIVLIPREQYEDRTEIMPATRKTPAHYKPHTLTEIVYGPDFYLPESKLYVEIKGPQFDTADFRLKIRLFKHLYEDKPIIIIKHHKDFSRVLDAIVAVQAKLDLRIIY